MKRMYIDKLQLVLNDWKENDIEFVDDDQMRKLYEYLGDDVFYDRDSCKMETTRKGQEYIKIKERD